MTTNKERKNQQFMWKGTVSQGPVETEDTVFWVKTFILVIHTLNCHFIILQSFLTKNWYARHQITLIFVVHNAIWIKVALEQVKMK